MKILTFDLFEKKDDPCWKGYKQVGMKKKNGKEVPNCVPDPKDKIEKSKKNEHVTSFEEFELVEEKSSIPDRYKEMGFTKVGQKKNSTRPGKKWMVLAKKGEDYKVVHGGDSNMEDYSQHHDKERRSNFWDRMGGKDSSKANDPFSPLYWHKKFKTW